MDERLSLPVARDGETLPIIVNNNNFAKARAGRADAAVADDVRTLFHDSVTACTGCCRR